MAIGRISGPLLKADLLREGIDLAFETDLLYLDVDPGRIGINTNTPQYDLDVNGTTKSIGLEVSSFANIGNISFTGTAVSTAEPTLTLGTADNVVYNNTAIIDDITIENNVISTNNSNSNLELNPNGTGTVEIFADTNVYGSIVATGSITADGDITIGDADTDNIIINAEIASDIIPDVTDTYSLGSNPATGGKRWADVWTQNLIAGTIDVSSIDVAGVDLALRQGNIYYVAENGNDTFSGDHPNDPFASVKYAMSQASAGDTIHIYPGVYTEEFPLEIPVGVTVKGHSIRSVKIVPTTETRYNDCFLLNGECTVEDLTIADFYSGGNFFTTTAASAGSATINVGTAPFAHTYVTGGTINISGTDYNISNATYNETTGVVVITHSGPDAGIGTSVFVSGLVFSCNGGNRTFPDNGYAFRFATDFEVTTRSPYVRNISVITKGSVIDAVSDPRGFDSGDAGKGAYIDGAYATANSREAGCLFHSATFITPGVDAISITNGARVEWLNSFTYFANKGLNAFDSNDGLRGAGNTVLRVDNVSNGPFIAGETVEYYDDDGVTLLASGTIDSVDADGKIYVTGKQEGFETFSERGGKTITRYNNPVTDTAIKKYGTSSLQLDGTEDYIGVASQNDFGFGTGDFTLEGWFYANIGGLAGTRSLIDMRAGAATDTGLFFYQVGGVVRVFYNGTLILSGGSLSANTWHHIAVTRTGSTISLYVDGSRVATDASFSSDLGTTKPVIIGANYNGTASYWDGYIDEVRIVKGSAKYTGATYTVPAGELLSDSNTVLLLHFNNVDDSSVVIEDDTQVAQDIRFSGGATATSITLANYTDFGGELRSIASACVYGNYGAYGDGVGVLMYLISQNFAYIGTGKNVDNDNTLVLQQNEVTELNDAKIRFSSVDHQGDFRVGDLFYVNQETGEVTFTSSDLNIDTTTGLTITTGGSTTTITGEDINTGNLNISGNTISSTSGDIILDSASGTIKLNATGAFNIPIGDTASRPGSPTKGMIRYNTDNDLFEGYDGNWRALSGVYDLDLNTYITAELTPGANDNTIRFYSNNNLVADIDSTRLSTNRIEVDDITIDGNTISVDTTNTDLIISANGTGVVNIDDFAFKDNTITNTNPIAPTLLRNSGSGYVKIEGTGAVVIPIGTDLERPVPPYRELGMTRFNTDRGYLEIYDGTSWTSVAGAASGISQNDAEDLALEYVLVLG